MRRTCPRRWCLLAHPAARSQWSFALWGRSQPGSSQARACRNPLATRPPTKARVTLEVERRVDAAVKAAETAATERALEQHRFKDAEKDKQLADVRHQLEEANRKAQQGSQQTQGEVAEQDLEAQLHQAFPLEKFETVATGQRGADVLQRVVDQRGQVCGTIIWERKNAKNFSETWIPKLRED